MKIRALTFWTRWVVGHPAHVVSAGDVLDLPRQRAMGIIKIGWAEAV